MSQGGRGEGLSLLHRNWTQLSTASRTGRDTTRYSHITLPETVSSLLYSAFSHPILPNPNNQVWKHQRYPVCNATCDYKPPS
jgi:hypothetical protein